MAKTSVAVDRAPIDRLEEKVKLLVKLIERLRSEQVRSAEDNARLKSEVEGLRERVAESEQAHTEILALKAERDEVRTRVTDLLGQLEALDLK